MPDIIIIEDEDGLRESLFEGLSGAFPDSTLGAYGSVEAALEVIEVEPPKLVISDIRLPGQSGVDFLLAAKRRWPSIRFILITAYATLVTHEQASQYGAYRLLRKPFALKDLVAAVEKALVTEFTGSVEGISILELMQIANLGRKNLTISVRRGEVDGEIFFRDGEVVHARAGRLEGIGAFNEMVRWPSGDFETRSADDAPKITIQDRFQHLVLEAMRILDEENRPLEEGESETSSEGAEPASEAPAAPREPNADLARLTELDGFLGACLVGVEDGTVLGAEGGGPIDLELAATGNAEVIRAKRRTIAALEVEDRIEDILITLETQYHLVRFIESNRAFFLYLVLERGGGNLALARHALEALAADLD